MLDSHAHVLSRDTVSYPPSPPTADNLEFLAHNAFDAADLIARMDETGVERALIVQRSQFYGADNSYICAAAAASGGRLRAVCGVESRSLDCIEAGRHWLTSGAAGLRLMGRPKEIGLNWLGGDHAAMIWKLCADRGITLCVHLFPAAREEGLQLIERMLTEYPLRWLVIDHLSNAPITSPSDHGIDDALRRLAARGNVALKFTTIPLGGLTARGIDTGEVLDAYLGVFGENALIWGSDVTQSPGEYAAMVALAKDATHTFPDDIRDKLLGGNARRIYDWA